MKEISDSFSVKVTCSRLSTLRQAIELVMLKDRPVKGWKLNDGSLVFYWYCVGDETHEFPASLQVDTVFSLIKDWVDGVKPQESRPDIDGSADVGYELSTDSNSSYELFRVKPAWVLYHK